MEKMEMKEFPRIITWAGAAEWGSWGLDWGLEDGTQGVGEETVVWT